jgi:hypothetical protein
MNKILPFIFLYCCAAFSSPCQQKDEILKLDYFNHIPSTNEGCYGLYTYDTATLDKKHIIIVSDLQDSLFVNISGKKISLGIKNTIWISEKEQKLIYKGKGYTAILTISSTIPQNDEVSLDKGVF